MKDEHLYHKPRKRFGQNFLHDANIIHNTARAVAPKSDDHIIEIGPGMGALTSSFSGECEKLDVIELDLDLIPILKQKFGTNPNFAIHQADALKFNFLELYQGKPLRIIGNLPYNISTPLLFHLFSFSDKIKDMHFMLQKEVVDRLAAQANEKHYGRLGIMAQYHCQVSQLFTVPPQSFNPPPKVDSAIVRLEPLKGKQVIAKDPEFLAVVVRTAFNQRRKTLRNALKGLADKDIIDNLEVDLSLRPENLSLKDYIYISDTLTSDKVKTSSE